MMCVLGLANDGNHRLGEGRGAADADELDIGEADFLQQRALNHRFTPLARAIMWPDLNASAPRPGFYYAGAEDFDGSGELRIETS